MTCDRSLAARSASAVHRLGYLTYDFQQSVLLGTGGNGRSGCRCSCASYPGVAVDEGQIRAPGRDMEESGSAGRLLEAAQEGQGDAV